MRVFSVLYFTDNQQKYERFKDDCQDGLETAANKATEVILLESFKNDVPLFPSISALSKYLEKYEYNLSDLTVIIDSLGIVQSNSSKLLRAIMIEYPEVKFLFDGDKPPVDIIFCDEPMTLENLTLEEDESCLEILNNSIDNSSNKINPQFLSDIKKKTDKIWNELKRVLSVSSDQEINDGDFIKRIRDLKTQLLRTCAKKHVNDSFLRLPAMDSDLFVNIVHTRDNLFDASNVRYAIKQWKYAHLRVNTQNFKVVQMSRRDNLALSVEEENAQNRFNSYCLFANGYRVLPVTSAGELKTIGERVLDESWDKVSLVVRDYDLQFFDTTVVKSLCRFSSTCWNLSCMQEEGKEEKNINAINLIRGFRDNNNGQSWTIHLLDSPCWKNFYLSLGETGKNESNMSVFYDRFLYKITTNSKPIFFNNITEVKSECQVETSNRNSIPIYYVSKGTDKVILVHPVQFMEMDKNHSVFKRIACQFIKNKDKFELYLPGIPKPVSGVYYPFQKIPEVKSRYLCISRDLNRKIDTTREGHDHGTALDVYATVKSLLNRSKKYYEHGKYVHAAVLANEIIEYLNGFHESILLDAYHILAISENAIAMNIMGGDEDALKDDALFRIDKVDHDIERILRRNENRRELRYNVLNQIYSDCRRFCRDKEHFKAEDCFISAKAHVNEGYTPFEIYREFKSTIKRLKSRWKEKKNDISILDYD